MPPDKKAKGRPGKETASASRKTTATTSTESISAQVRRRREAALRLPPPGDAPADPLDDLPLPVPAQRGDDHRGEFAADGRLTNCCQDDSP